MHYDIDTSEPSHAVAVTIVAVFVVRCLLTDTLAVALVELLHLVAVRRLVAQVYSLVAALAPAMSVHVPHTSHTVQVTRATIRVKKINHLSLSRKLSEDT